MQGWGDGQTLSKGHVSGRSLRSATPPTGKLKSGRLTDDFTFWPCQLCDNVWIMFASKVRCNAEYQCDVTKQGLNYTMLLQVLKSRGIIISWCTEPFVKLKCRIHSNKCHFRERGRLIFGSNASESVLTSTSALQKLTPNAILNKVTDIEKDQAAGQQDLMRSVPRR